MTATGVLCDPSTKPLLPDGWRWVRLGDHTGKIGSGLTPLGGQASYVSNGVPLIRSQNVHMNRFVYCGLAFIMAEQDEAMRESRVQAGDVLLNITGASIGRVCVVPNDIVPANVNQHVSIIRSDGSFDPWYLSFFFSTPGFQKYITDTQAGATRQALTKGLIESFAVPLPPLSEQRRIAAVLREQIASVEKARTAVQERLEAAKALPASLLRQVFPQSGQRLTDGWRWVRLGQVCEINPRRTAVDWSDETLTSFIPMEAVNAEQGVISHTRERPFCEVKKGYTYFQERDVLFAKITPCMQNGKHAVARGLINGFGFASTEFHVIRPSNEILSEWIHYFVRQPAILREAANHLTGAVGQQRVPDAFLKPLDIPLPTLPEQRRIAVLLREQMAAAKKACAAAEEELKTINALPAALLRRAFIGAI